MLGRTGRDGLDWSPTFGPESDPPLRRMRSLFGKIATYYKLSREKGHGPITTVVLMPFSAIAYAKRRLAKGDQITGYGRYDLPLLASYSRSGTNWFRYVVESLSGRPTPGQVRLHLGTDYILDRAHCAHEVVSRYGRVILLLRDPRECLVRHHQDLWRKSKDVVSFLEDETVFQKPSWYISNIAAFDSADVDKLLVYYEDLMSNPEEVIPRVAEFLGLDVGRAREFSRNLEAVRRRSVSSYTSKGHASVTSDKNDPRYHAKRNLTEQQQREFDEYYRLRYPRLWERYLKRYAVLGQGPP